MDGGRSQREAVTVIFRLLEAMVAGEMVVAHGLLERALSLDVAGVNSELLASISDYIKSNADDAAKWRLRDNVAGTPYEVAASPLFRR